MRGAAGFSPLLAWIGLAAGLAGCAPLPSTTPPVTPTASPEPARQPARVTFGRPQARVGERRRRRFEIETDTHAEIQDGRGGARRLDARVTKTFETLEETTATSEGAATALRVTVLRVEGSVRESDGPEQKEEPEAAGRIYLVRNTSDGTRVAREDGTRPDEGETEEIARYYGGLRRWEEALARVLPREEVVVGARFPELVSPLWHAFLAAGGMTYEASGVIVLAGRIEDEARFEVEMTSSAKGAVGTTTGTFRGELRIALATGQLTYARVSGPFTLRGAQGGASVSGQGTLTVVVESKAVP